jgi:hypothetical protein
MEDNLNAVPVPAGESQLALSQPQVRELLARNWIKAQPSLKAFIIASTPQFSDAEDLKSLRKSPYDLTITIRRVRFCPGRCGSRRSRSPISIA